MAGRTLALWATVGMIPSVLGSLLGRSGGVAHRQLGGMGWGRSTAREWAEARHGALGKVLGVWVHAIPPSLAAHVVHLGHLMRLLLSVEHHLLVRPLGELSVRGIVIGHLSLLRVGRMAMHGVGLLVRILIERRVELLRRRGPCSLLLLNGVRVWLLLRHGGLCKRVLVGGRGALTGYRWVDGVRGGRVHAMISRWMPVLRRKNGHGLRVARKKA